MKYSKEHFPEITTAWLNNHTVVEENIEKPCHKLNYCPYGQLVEEFPFSEDHKSCKVFGHDCPVFYHAEDFAEEKQN